MKIIGLDFETFYIKKTTTNPGYSVAQLGNWAYCHDPRFDAYLVSAYDGHMALACEPEDFCWEELEGALLVSHNKAFDEAVYERLVELGEVPRIQFADWVCSANLSSYLVNHRNLKDASKTLLGKVVSKTERDAMNGRQWADVKRDEPELAQRLIEYAKQDVINCREIWVKHGHKWPAHERALSELTIKQGRDGVAIDTDLLRRGLELTTTALRKIEALLPWTEEGKKPAEQGKEAAEQGKEAAEQGKKPTSSKAIADQCIKAGIPAPPIIKHEGEEAYEEWEKEFGDKHEWVRNVSVWRSVNKVLSTLETVKARLRPDNTIDFSLLYFGGHTGRWSGGGSGLNMQNLRKDPLLFDTEGRYVFEAARLKEYTASKDTKPAWLAHELNMRHLICARPGHKFVIVDAAQIEPRCLNWLAGNKALLAKIAEGFSYYEAYAATFEGWKGEKGSIKKSLGPAAYTKLKNKCLGLGFGMGWAKYVDYAGVDEEEAKKVVEGFRAENPLIAGSDGLWSRLDTAYRGCAAKPMQKPTVEHTFESELPSGRCLTYPNVKSEWRNTMGKDKKWHMKLQVTCEVGFRREKLYGGKLTENLVQATARDVFAHHMLELVANGLPVVFHVHDENIIEVPEGDAPEALKKAIEIMSVPPPWLPGCPLSAEGIIADHYKK